MSHGETFQPGVAEIFFGTVSVSSPRKLFLVEDNKHKSWTQVQVKHSNKPLLQPLRSSWTTENISDWSYYFAPVDLRGAQL